MDSSQGIVGQQAAAVLISIWENGEAESWACLTFCEWGQTSPESTTMICQNTWQEVEKCCLIQLLKKISLEEKIIIERSFCMTPVSKMTRANKYGVLLGATSHKLLEKVVGCLFTWCMNTCYASKHWHNDSYKREVALWANTAFVLLKLDPQMWNSLMCPMTLQKKKKEKGKGEAMFSQ